MSWTNECCTSNSFKVKNVEEVKQVIEQMGFAVYKNEDNSIQFYSTGEGYDEDKEYTTLNECLELWEGNGYVIAQELKVEG